MSVGQRARAGGRNTGLFRMSITWEGGGIVRLQALCYSICNFLHI